MGYKRKQKKTEPNNGTVPAQRLIEYVPPKPEIIRAFARLVCETLAEETNDPSFVQADVMHGFANFLIFAAQVQAKHLNAQQLVDKDEK